MDRVLANRASCVVCGIETKRHHGWFLVVENCWLDRVKVLSWHPALAVNGRTHAVCGKIHLKALLAYWLQHANLQSFAIGSAAPPRVLETDAHGYSTVSAGGFLGELAVERNQLSAGWTGSPEAMECILNALIGETELRSRSLPLASLERRVEYPRNYAFPMNS